MRYGDLTYLEIRDRAREGWLAIVPTGCTEQQGPHLPVDSDTWAVQTKTLAAAERAAERHGVNALVLPAMPFGPTPEHRNFGWGYIDVPTELHEALVRAVLESLAEPGLQPHHRLARLWPARSARVRPRLQRRAPGPLHGVPA